KLHGRRASAGQSWAEVSIANSGRPRWQRDHRQCPAQTGADYHDEQGSIIIVIATDAPLLPHQLKRLAKRAALGVARTGGVAGNGSGDIFIAFSTANSQAAKPARLTNRVQMVLNDNLTPLFEATILATEEAIINAMIAAETLAGINGHKVYSIPHRRLMDVMKKYNRSIDYRAL